MPTDRDRELLQLELLAQIRDDLGIPEHAEDGCDVLHQPEALLQRAAHDLGITLPREGLRSDIQYVCVELGIETPWGWQPPTEPTPTEPSLGEAEAEAELSHAEKVRAVFEKFDEDGDGRLNFHEASAYSLAKEGEPLDDATWAEVCGALGFDAARGMSFEHFERMYDTSARGEGNDINVDYMRLCEGLRITISSARISHETPLLVRIARTERSDDAKEELYVVEVTEEFDDYVISSSAYRFKDFVALRTALEKEFDFLSFPSFPSAKRQPDRVERLDAFLGSIMDHPTVKRSRTFCSFINIVADTGDDVVDIDFDSLGGQAGEQSRMHKTMIQIYDTLVEGKVPGMQSAAQMGDEWRRKVKGSLRDRVDALIRAQNLKSGAQGFVTSLGGLPVLAATLPANIVALLYLWIRMSAAIAHIGGEDVRSDETRALVFLTLLGGDMPEVERAGGQAALMIPLIIKRILFVFAKRGAGSVARKAVPIVAGFASAAYDSHVTNQIGNTARDIFVPPDWVKEEQTRTGLGIMIFFPSTRLARWVELLRERVQEDEKPTVAPEPELELELEPEPQPESGGGETMVTAAQDHSSQTLQLRRQHYRRAVLPRVVAAYSDYKRSTYLSITNASGLVLTRQSATLIDGEWSAELPVDLLPGEKDVPGSCHTGSDKIQGECCFAAETGSGRIDVKLYWTNQGSTFEWDAETVAPLRVEGVATAERNNMVEFRISAGFGTWRRTGGTDKLANRREPTEVEASMRLSAMPLVEAATHIDIEKQLDERKRNFTEFVVPRLVTATKARRSSCVMIVNETKATLHLVNSDCVHGLWTVEAPGEVFPGETVLFGSHGSSGGTEASVEFLIVSSDSHAADVSGRCWLTWSNPLSSGQRGKWWDAECDAPLRVDAIASQDDNNKVTFRILNGAGTVRKYGDDSGGDEAANSIVVPILSEEEIAAELVTRRELFNTQHLPQLIAAQMKATRSTMLSLTNQTDATFCRSRMELSDGAWTVEPPNLLLPHESDVPFGSESRGLLSLVKGKIELVTDTLTDTGRCTIWISWTNGGRGEISADGAAPIGFQVSVVTSDAENNTVKITISRGSGTTQGNAMRSPARSAGDSGAVGPAEAGGQLQRLSSSGVHPVLKAGWLSKQGDGGLFSSSQTYKRRWCTVTDIRMELLVEEGGRRKGMIDLRNLSQVRKTSAGSAAGSVDKWTFELVCREGVHRVGESATWVVHSFEAPDERARDEWLAVLDPTGKSADSVSDRGSPSPPSSAAEASVSQLTDALLLSPDDDHATTTGGRADTRLRGVDVVRECLEHSQLVLMGSVHASPMATRKVLYKSATKLLQDDHDRPVQTSGGGLLAQQPLFHPALWETQSSLDPGPTPGPQQELLQQRERATGVAELMRAILAGQTDSTDQEDIARIESFLSVIQKGPG